MHGYSDTFARRVHPLVRLSLDRYRPDRNTEKFRKTRTYRIHMRTKLRLFAYYRYIDIPDCISRLRNLIHYGAEQFCGIRILPARVRIRKMRSDISKGRCAEKRINNRMNKHVRIRMPFELRAPRNDHTTQLLRRCGIRDAGSAPLEAVRIVPETNSHAKCARPPSMTAVLADQFNRS